MGKGKVGGGLQVAETLRMRPVWQGTWAVMRSMEGRVRTGALTAYEAQAAPPLAGLGTHCVQPALLSHPWIS